MQTPANTRGASVYRSFLGRVMLRRSMRNGMSSRASRARSDWQVGLSCLLRIFNPVWAVTWVHLIARSDAKGTRQTPSTDGKSAKSRDISRDAELGRAERAMPSDCAIATSCGSSRGVRRRCCCEPRTAGRFGARGRSRRRVASLHFARLRSSRTRRLGGKRKVIEDLQPRNEHLPTSRSIAEAREQGDDRFGILQFR